MSVMSECKAEVASGQPLYQGGKDLANCFGKILGEAVEVILGYERATNTRPLKQKTAFQLLDILFYDDDNATKRGFNLTAENTVFIKQYVSHIIGGRLGWHVDEYIASLPREDV